ncbi:MAG: hypothetical protein HQM00_05510 [Magnetococcales bacterium]|nr:hypothetical protein [Magnetococcales bacterium]
MKISMDMMKKNDGLSGRVKKIEKMFPGAEEVSAIDFKSAVGFEGAVNFIFSFVGESREKDLFSQVRHLAPEGKTFWEAWNWLFQEKAEAGYEYSMSLISFEGKREALDRYASILGRIKIAEEIFDAAFSDY